MLNTGYGLSLETGVRRSPNLSANIPLVFTSRTLHAGDRMLVIEVDGSQHVDSPHDAKRDKFMRSSGWAILRFWNVDVLREMEAVLETTLAVRKGV